MKNITAGELAVADIGQEIRVPLSNGASVQDILLDVFHSTRPVRVDDFSFGTFDKPFTLIRFKNTRPAPNWQMQLPKDLDYLREFFEVATDTEVVVSEPSDAGKAS